MDLKFGMFVHWGPVSLKGTEIGWSRGREVPNEEYDNLYKEFGDLKYKASPLLKKMVRANHLGRETQRGFYKYNEEGKRIVNKKEDN